MEQPDHDIESQRADASPSEDEHDEVPPLSDEGGPGRGSLATEAAAGTVGDVVAGSLVGWVAPASQLPVQRSPCLSREPWWLVA